MIHMKKADRYTWSWGLWGHLISKGLCVPSCVLRFLGWSLRAELVVLPMLTDLSALLGDQLSPQQYLCMEHSDT